jgi:hypothetical protein
MARDVFNQRNVSQASLALLSHGLLLHDVDDVWPHEMPEVPEETERAGGGGGKRDGHVGLQSHLPQSMKWVGRRSTARVVF